MGERPRPECRQSKIHRALRPRYAAAIPGLNEDPPQLDFLEAQVPRSASARRGGIEARGMPRRITNSLSARSTTAALRRGIGMSPRTCSGTGHLAPSIKVGHSGCQGLLPDRA